MNKVILKGRTTRTPEIKYFDDADVKCYARFTLAVEDRSWKLEDDKFHVDYIGCYAAGKLAEIIERCVGKGQEILICGKWRTGSYEKDGEKVYTNSLFIQELEFCGKKSDNPNNQEPDFSFMDGVNDDDLPFA